MNHHQSPPHSGGIRKPPPHRPPLGLTRYGSAPGSFLSGIADSVVAGGGAAGFRGRMFPGQSPALASESSCKSDASAASLSCSGPQQRSYGVGEASVADLASGDSRGGGNPLLRHRSSPAGFFSNPMLDSGFPVPRDFGSCPRPGIEGVNEVASRRLKSQLSFSGSGIPDIGDIAGCSNNSDVTSGSVSQSYISSNFSIGSWDDTNSIIFSAPPSKQAKDNNGDIISVSNIESQFSLPNTTLEMATMDKYLQLQHGQVPFKVRAKRGCATHPRSIAERISFRKGG